MRRLGFTMLELVFVIVIMGILGKFGVELLAQAYNNFIFSSINNTLQSQSASAVESIASRLQFRIKDSIIARKTDLNFEALSGVSPSFAADATILEWVGSDIDGFRGDSIPLWSGIIDLDESNATSLDSPETNTTALNNLIAVLSHGSGTTIDDAAIFFVGSDSDKDKYGWLGGAFLDQSSVMHPVKSVAGQPDKFAPTTVGDFSGVDVFEYYQLAWTAYAVGISDYNATGNETGTLKLYYDYQPWQGERYTTGKDITLMDNVSTFRFKAVGSVIKIQVCVNSEVVEDYSLCKEKTIY